MSYVDGLEVPAPKKCHDARDDATAFLLRAASSDVPASTRSVVVTITMTRHDGDDDDGSTDSLSRVLDGV